MPYRIEAKPKPTYMGLYGVFVTQSESQEGIFHITCISQDISESICSCKGFQVRKSCRHVKDLSA